MESAKRAIVLAAVLAFLRSREKLRKTSKAVEEGSPVSSWRLARAFDIIEYDASSWR